MGRLRWILGSLLCAGTAGFMTLLYEGRAGRENLPLVFLVVITLAAIYFGVAAGITGSISAALIFALFLFPPLGSLRVGDDQARSNVGWMLLGGIAVSYLLASRPPSNSIPPSSPDVA